MIRTYDVTLTGLSPLIHHQDNIEWAGRMKEWREVPANKKRSVAGDDRSPAFTWIGCLYHDGTHATIPADNLMRCLMEGGAGVVVPGGRNGKTFKAQAMSGMLVGEAHWPILVDKKPVDVRGMLKLTGEMEFEKHQRAAENAGFALFVKRAGVNNKKHVRVRPRFDSWSARGTVQVWDDQITLGVLRDILTVAGTYKGMCDWRPSSKTPGPYGRFSAEVEQAE